MIGFSFSDRELTLLFESIRDSLKYRTHPDYIFLAEGETGPVEARRWREDFGLEVIPYTLSDPSRPEVWQFVEALATHVPPEAAGVGIPKIVQHAP